MVPKAKGEKMTILSGEWATERCDLHDLVSCADCLASAKARRDPESGEVRYQSDCAVATFSELTGASYEESADLLLAAGFVPGKGTRSDYLLKALADSGFTTRDVTYLGIESALAASRNGRSFYVSGRTGRKGHAWTLIDGEANRDYLRGYRYRYNIYEVS